MQTPSFRTQSLVLILLALQANLAFAEPTESRLAPIIVDGRQDDRVGRADETESGKINSGKKTTVTPLSALPSITNNNYRQALAHTPGLLTSEVANQSFTSFNYRGVGDPHETYNFMVLQDGLPIAADPFGYPAVYYTPTLDYVDRMEFIRGGASLLYGPQPGGALNYVTRQPATDRAWAFRSKQLGGGQGLYQTYNEASGTQGALSYLAQVNHRQSSGFRQANSDFRIDGGALKLAYKTSARSRLGLSFDAYKSNSGEAGGLALTSASGANGLNGDWTATSLFNDRLQIERQNLALDYVSQIDEATQVSVKLWGGSMKRISRRQAVGSAPTFGGIANGSTNTIQDQRFTTWGSEARASHDWDLFGGKHTVAGGLTYSSIDSPYRQERGATPTADSGDLQKDLMRKTRASSVYVENRFVIGKLKVIPGVRYDMIGQSINESTNSGATVPLRSNDITDRVPLLGLGTTYELPLALEAYGNISQGYKPVTFADAVPLNTGDTVSSDLKAARSTAMEAGVRGRPIEPLLFDVSVFRMDFSDQFGRVGTNLQNVGRSKHEGIDIMTELELTSLLDQELGSDWLRSIGQISLHANASLLSASFTEGSQNGKTPQYAPSELIRAGLTYARSKDTKVALLGTFVSRHYADDANTESRAIPSYSVWDLTGEVKVLTWNQARDSASVLFGINNLFDQRYYSRVRSNGIEPASPRQLYAGLNVVF